MSDLMTWLSQQSPFAYIGLTMVVWFARYCLITHRAAWKLRIENENRMVTKLFQGDPYMASTLKKYQQEESHDFSIETTAARLAGRIGYCEIPGTRWHIDWEIFHYVLGAGEESMAFEVVAYEPENVRQAMERQGFAPWSKIGNVTVGDLGRTDGRLVQYESHKRSYFVSVEHGVFEVPADDHNVAYARIEAILNGEGRANDEESVAPSLPDVPMPPEVTGQRLIRRREL